MKGFIVALIAFFALSAQGCVTMSKYDELKDKNASLSAERAALQQENRKLTEEVDSLKKNRDSLRADLESLNQVADYYYQMGMEHFSKKNYRSAADFFERVTDRYPLRPAAKASREKLREISAISAENYKKTLRSIDAAKDAKAKLEILDNDISERYFSREDSEKLLHRREIISNEVSLVEEMNKHIIMEDDPTHSVRRYRTTRPTSQEISQEKAFAVELYITHQYAGKKRYHIKARYSGDGWISYDSLQFRGENGAHIDIICKYPEKLSRMGEDRIFEWSDNEVDEDKVSKLLKSDSISVRFGGGYKFSFNLNDQQLTAFREIAKKYSTLK